MWIKDVEREIMREREENRLQKQDGDNTKRIIQAERRSDERQKARRKKQRLSKRETLLEMLMGAVVGGTGGSRRPRKIESGGSNLQQEARGDPHILLTCFDSGLKPERMHGVMFFSHPLGFAEI